MFQDWEHIPDFLISECSLLEDTFKYFELTDKMDLERAEAFEIYFSSIVSWPSNWHDLEETQQRLEESYQGYYSGSMKEPKPSAAAVGFTFQYIKKTRMLANAPDIRERYSDYEAFAKDLFLEGYSEYDSHIFADY